MSDLVYLQDESVNAVHPDFSARFATVKANFFSRNPDLWPVFREPGFASLNEFRARGLAPDARLNAWPDGRARLADLCETMPVPATMRTPGEPMAELLFAAALSKDWENPSSVENVITMSADPAIYGAQMGILANPNLVYSEYAGVAEELEKKVVRQIALLAGYDPARATGIFTQGGTFCNLYGYLLGIRKTLPEAKHKGLGHYQDYRIINSQGGHYSNITNLSLLGVDIENKTIRIQVGENNDIDLDHLERTLTACFALKHVVPTIMLTMGTTDTFGVDQVKPVFELRNRLCEQFEVTVKPHIHVDAAIGWSMIFFLDYDFAANPLAINSATLAGIERNVARFAELKYADSFTVDFQKWGYVPYTSSLVMIKEQDDLKAMENDPENFSYFERDIQGQTHLQSTIECSRGASGLFGAYAALNYMGVEGYRIVLAHCLQNANYFRYRLSQLGNVKLVAQENQGPSVGFKIYNPEWVSDPEAEFAFELARSGDPAYKARLQRNTDYHRSLFKGRGKVGLYTNWVEAVAHSDYDARGKYSYIAGEKAVFMNPACTREQINAFINHIRG
ncbi:pyridoxal phosphate-dependent decarboxylase family protein [Aeromonas veronii]|uniref:pyridoxal phosphate-dependent decarboxylase family protein n=1 Tax=Aeromonas veronii TaxID=654 RepID=UPI002714D9CC|nr:pyridoxal-dependent decarboxylase [Aeromonas veronii]WLD19197.1 pyridoxal-dependent decarboxylase [Aeromonas veronii]